MCNFFAGIATRETVYTHPMLDAHSDILQYYGLPDDAAEIVRVELLPVDWTDISTWAYRVDQDYLPAWWAERVEAAEAEMRARATRMLLLTGQHHLIIDGCWIVGGDAHVEDIRGGRISHVGGHAAISGVWGHATISDVGGHAAISGVWGHATISDVRGHATISEVGDQVILDMSAQEHRS